MDIDENVEVFVVTGNLKKKLYPARVQLPDKNITT
jgi:hypothetical protein